MVKALENWKVIKFLRKVFYNSGETKWAGVKAVSLETFKLAAMGYTFFISRQFWPLPQGFYFSKFEITGQTLSKFLNGRDLFEPPSKNR